MDEETNSSETKEVEGKKDKRNKAGCLAVGGIIWFVALYFINHWYRPHSGLSFFGGLSMIASIVFIIWVINKFYNDPNF